MEQMMDHDKQREEREFPQEELSNLLPRLWRQQLAVILANLIHDKREHEEIAQASRLIGVDYKGRFLLELLQNGYDAIMKTELQYGKITIVRKESFFAVGNQGAPFDHSGLRSITSLALSDKDLSLDIGHKGVGFKSVFDVTHEPIILSASGGGLSPQASGLRFKLSLEPFASPSGETKLKQYVEDLFLEACQQVTTPITDQTEWRAALEEAAHKAAGFKFPTEVSAKELQVWRDQLPEMAEFITVVILPIRQQAQDKAKLAILELWDALDEVSLFLPGLSEITLFDHVENRKVTVRREPEEKVPANRVVHIERVKISRELEEHETLEPLRSFWWVASRELGSQAKNREEADTIRTAAAELGRKWRDVDAAVVRVALPIPNTEGPFNKQGLFAIGLPTEKGTGTPFWVDSSFYSGISRKDIDFTQPYNGFLLEVSASVVADLLEMLKRRAESRDKRLVTFSRQVLNADSKFVKLLHEADCYFDGQCFLGFSGGKFFGQDELCMLKPEDLDVLVAIGQPLDSLADLGFVLADSLIMKHAESLFRDDEGKPYADVSMFLDQSPGNSLIEQLAHTLRRRNAPSEDWETFLSWVLRLSRLVLPDELVLLQKQRFLPTVGGALMAPSENVFIPPRSKRDEHETSEDGDLDSNGDSDDLDEPSDIPEDVRSLLHFLDDCVVAREPNGRLTDLGRSLKPDDSSGFVRRPRPASLILYAIKPALVEAIADIPNQHRAVKLIEAATDLLHGQRAETARDSARQARLLVPTCSREDGWRAASELYFGRGWLEVPEDEQLLHEAVGPASEIYVLDWPSFQMLAGDRRSKDWWRRGLDWLGVAKLPRLIRPQIRGRSPAPFRAAYNYQLVINNEELPRGLPVELKPYWLEYLKTIEGRKSLWMTSYITYGFNDVVWVDGLEDPEHRLAVVDLIMKYPEAYQETTAHLYRTDNNSRYDETEENALWVNALKSNHWNVLRDDEGNRAGPDELWLVEQRDRGPETRYSHLRCLQPGFDKHKSLLSRLGISHPEDVDYERLIGELHRQAVRLREGQVDGTSRTLLTLVVEFYDRMDKLVAETQNTDLLLDKIFSAPVPLLKQNVLSSIDLDTLSSLFIDDDKERRPYVIGAADGVYLPVKSRTKLDHLADLLNQRLDIRFTSRAELAIRLSNLSESENLLDFLVRNKGDELIIALGCIIAYCRPDQMDPGKDRFNTLWQLLENTKIRLADMDDRAPDAISNISEDGSGRILIIRRTLDKEVAVLRGLWQILGAGYKHVLNSFVLSFRHGLTSDFLEKEHIGPQEQQTVREVVFQSRMDDLLFQYPSLLLLRRKTDPETTPDELRSILEGCNDLDSAWHLVCPPDLLDEIVDLPTDDRVNLALQLTKMSGFTVKDWQSARIEFGNEPFVFRESMDFFLWAKRRSCAVFKALIGRQTRRNFDLNEARGLLEAIGELEPPDEIAHEPPSVEVIGSILVKSSRELFENAGGEIAKFLRRYLENWVEESTPYPSGRGQSGNDVDEYLHAADETLREQNAIDTLSEYKAVIHQLASSFDEDIEPVLADLRLAMFSQGWWANKYILLRHLSHLLRQSAQETYKKLQEIQAFRRPLSSQELRLKLGLEAPDTASPTPQPITLLGDVELPEDQIDSELSKGTQGAIGLALQDHLDETVDLTALAHRAREDVKPKPSRSSGGRGGRKPAERRGSHELTGAMGEAFIYELFSKKFGDHGFDLTSWKSKDKHRYLGIEGSDLLGYDFDWFDTQGFLAKPDQNCLIEVKSTSGREEAFPISVTEWDRAKEAHYNPEETYVIIRVTEALTNPQVSDVFIDPVQLEIDRKLSLDDFGGLLRPGSPVD